MPGARSFSYVGSREWSDHFNSYVRNIFLYFYKWLFPGLTHDLMVKRTTHDLIEIGIQNVRNILAIVIL
jgi:hypothetical protein